MSSTCSSTRALQGILAACLLVIGEGALVLAVRHREVSSLWELNHGIFNLAPWALPAAALAGLCGAVLLAWLEAAADDAWACWKLGGAALLGAGVAAWAVGGGRHLAGTAQRLGLAGLVGVGVGWIAIWIAPRWAGIVRNRRPVAGLTAAGVLLGLEVTNRFVLVRLYPGFHASLALAAVVLAPSLAWLVPLESNGVSRAVTPRNNATALGLLAVAGALAGLCYVAPDTARNLAHFDNFRLILLNDAPLLGQSVRIAARLAPPPPLSRCEGDDWDESCGVLESAGKGAGFSLKGSDILLITVDALRADHLGVYGYARNTSPNIDRLAADAVRFDNAYAPTPHTSYSVTSLMTGKYMRPLLLQGAGADSDTWASLLRRYGYRTAAFYPPAVFFIDPQRFEAFRDTFLGFEYRKVEFLEGPARAQQVTRYVDSQPVTLRLFVWVHLFGPHEPYEGHDGFDFGPRDIDRYDSEIAYADAAIGVIADAFLSKRPNGLIIVSADHGEEFGEHGGRYHGSSVYEEQVRVPLVMRAPSLFKPHAVADPVQTIDLLPTVLAALDVPRPPRLRGRSIGPLLAANAEPGVGLALAETEEQIMLAQANFRLVCARQVGACQLFDIATDGLEQHDIAAAQPDRFERMRRRQRELSASHGQYETQGLRAEGKGWPNPILRGVAGDGDAVEEIASLLDDADTAIRRKAAELLFELDRPSIASALRLALTRDDDPVVRAWCALSLTRLGQGAPLVYDLLAGGDVNFSRLAALALADSGDARGVDRLVSWWRDTPARNYQRSRWLLAAFARLRAKSAVSALVHSLNDVRLRPEIASTLADIGDFTARGPLVLAFAEERYQDARVALAKSLVRLGAREELARPLLRFLGVPDPIPGGLGIAMQAKVLEYVGGPQGRELAGLTRNAGIGTRVRLVIPRAFGTQTLGLRCLVRVSNQGSRPGQVRVLSVDDMFTESKNPQSLTLRNFNSNSQTSLVFEVPINAASIELYQPVPTAFRWAPGHSVAVDVLATTGVKVEALAVLPAAPELPPPPPEPWSSGVAPTDSQLSQ
jgi:arylsulfatase A-like enzyme